MSKPAGAHGATGLRQAVLAWICAWLLLAAGCGPGVGGTGTGTSAAADPLPAFGAQPASLCGSALAGALHCSSASGPGLPAPNSAPALFADSPTARRASASVQGDRIELTLLCERLRFTGDWGAAPGQAERFYGTVVFEATGESALATLAAERSGSGMAVQLRNERGEALAGPQLLLPVAALGPAACP